MTMHTEMWFPSVIWSEVVKNIDNNKIKEFAYNRKLYDPGRVISNYGGYQSTDLTKGENSEIDRFVDYLNLQIESCAKQVGLPSLTLYNLWININPPGSYNHLHNHVGSVLSGSYYIDANPTQGNIQFERSDGGEYHIPEKIEKETYFTCTRATYAAKTGALYIFPSWMKHSVQGNISDSDRVSLAFNYGEIK